MKDTMIQRYHMEFLMKMATKTTLKIDYIVEEGSHSPVWCIDPQEYSNRLNKFFSKIENDINI